MIPLKPRQQEHAHLSCPTCSDEGLPALVLGIDNASGLARVATGEGEREVALDLVDGVAVGDYVLVHIDTAIARLNPGEVMAP